MTFFYFVIYALWVLPILLQAAIVFAMVRRKLVKTFPVFFSYTVWVLFSAAALLFFRSGHLFHRLYSCEEAISVVLGFAVVFEILGHILPPFPSPRLVMNLVWVLAGLFAVFALLMFISAKPLMGNYALYEVIVLAERSIRFLQASLLIVVIALMSVLGLTWQNESLGILIGFGVYSVVALLAFGFAALHWMNPIAFSMLNSAGYNLATLIWAFYILRPQRSALVAHLENSELAEWINALNEDADQWSQRS